MLETLLNLDGGFLLFLQDSVRNPILNSIMIFITSLGDGGIIWIAATIALLIPKKTRKVGIMSAVALLGSLLINNNLIKNIVQRPRPYVTFTDLQIIIPQPSEFSFPSGHTSSSFASAAVFYRHLPKKFGVPAVILAALIGFSRLYVGVHYPTDVLAGAVMGILLSYMAEYLVDFLAKKLKKG
ncbi:MAG: phosphatase PAP2 family protein [Lachnospiraceae bacterium]|nr:phosphatase PAP2 family protein [Lachnospiraceae bacterium]MEE1014777.1 phosphatase PAP2 family protein [Lachnospiraceae bacterium]